VAAARRRQAGRTHAVRLCRSGREMSCACGPGVVSQNGVARPTWKTAALAAVGTSLSPSGPVVARRPRGDARDRPAHRLSASRHRRSSREPLPPRGAGGAARPPAKLQGPVEARGPLLAERRLLPLASSGFRASWPRALTAERAWDSTPCWATKCRRLEWPPCSSLPS
jgi:hypothetical protein